MFALQITKANENKATNISVIFAAIAAQYLPSSFTITSDLLSLCAHKQYVAARVRKCFAQNVVRAVIYRSEGEVKKFRKKLKRGEKTKEKYTKRSYQKPENAVKNALRS